MSGDCCIHHLLFIMFIICYFTCYGISTSVAIYCFYGIQIVHTLLAS
jgi:hypothetical protein